MNLRDKLSDLWSSDVANNKIASVMAGLLFFAGWWILIDAMAVDKGQISTGHVFIGVFGSVSFFMVNAVKNSHISEDYSAENFVLFAKTCLLIGFFMGFASIVAAIWVMIEVFFCDPEKDNMKGIALFLQNIFILISSLVYKFCRNEADWIQQ